MANVTLLTESVELIRKAKSVLELMQATKRTMVRRLKAAGSDVQDLYDEYHQVLTEIQHSPHDKRDTDLLEGQVIDLKTAANSCLLDLDGFGELDVAIEAIDNISTYPMPLMDRFWCGVIEEQNGEREYTHVIFYRDQTREGAEKQHLEMASGYYNSGHKTQLDEDGRFNFGDVSVIDGSLWEISKLTYKEMGSGSL